MISVKGKPLCVRFILPNHANFAYQCIVTLTFDLLTWKSLGHILDSSGVCTEYETSHMIGPHDVKGEKTKWQLRRLSSGWVSACTRGEWLQLAIWDRGFNTEWIREVACKCISMILFGDELCFPYTHIPLWAHILISSQQKWGHPLYLTWCISRITGNFFNKNLGHCRLILHV